MNRFVDQKTMVLDTHSGLMWAKNASLSEFPMTWREAFTFMQTLNRSETFGYSDWKLPNRKELFSLMSHHTINPSLPEKHPFINVFNGYYWTSTSCARLPNQAWYIHLGGARVFKGMKHGSYMVWPVRLSDATGSSLPQTGQRYCYDDSGRIRNCLNTGQDGEFQSGLRLDTDRFSDRTDCIYDHLTGLTWLKPFHCPAEEMSWQAAFDFVNQLNQQGGHGYQDWRMPGIFELESLTDMGRHSPALPDDHLFTEVQELFWSATTSRYNPDYAWVLYLKDGGVGVGYKPLPEFHLWPVRGNHYRLPFTRPEAMTGPAPNL